MPIYYHISRADLGASPTLTPKVPESCVPEREGWTPRVCFAPTIEQCLYSIAGGGATTLGDAVFEFLGPWKPKIANPTVYITEQRLHKPDQTLSDFKLTGERHSHKPITVTRLGYIDLRASMFRRSFVSTPNLLSKDNKWCVLTKHEHQFWLLGLKSTWSSLLNTAHFAKTGKLK